MSAPPRARGPRITVVGAGWAGLAAAVAACQASAQVQLYEANRLPGGRARSLPLPESKTVLDNGQHILIGAYKDTLALMCQVGVDPEQVLHRLPLALRFADGSGLQLPDAPPPWDALAGILGARGWPWADRMALLARAGHWRLQGFDCPAGTTVAQLCAGLSPRLLSEFIDPLCVSALNTPADQACAQVFLRVLKDSLFSGRGGSNLLLPKAELGRLLPDAACSWLQRQGAQVHLGQRVSQISPTAQGWMVNGQACDQLILATPSTETWRLVHQLPAPADWAEHHAQWCQTTADLRFEAITTVYAHTTAPTRWPVPMLALRAGPGAPAQFVFDRGQLGGPQGLLAWVISASQGSREQLEQAVVAQAHEQLGLPITPLKTITEKRATFACTAGLARPSIRILPRLWAAGDYLAGPYPATLEGAVRSGLQVVQQAMTWAQLTCDSQATCLSQSP